MKKPKVLFAVPLFLFLISTPVDSAPLGATSRDKEKPNSRSGKRASVKTTHVRSKYSIANRLRPTSSRARGGFYSIKHHDYSFHIFKHRVTKKRTSKNSISE